MGMSSSSRCCGRLTMLEVHRVKTMDRIADAFELQSWQVLAELDGAVLR